MKQAIAQLSLQTGAGLVVFNFHSVTLDSRASGQHWTDERFHFSRRWEQMFPLSSQSG